MVSICFSEQAPTLRQIVDGLARFMEVQTPHFLLCYSLKAILVRCSFWSCASYSGRASLHAGVVWDCDLASSSRAHWRTSAFLARPIALKYTARSFGTSERSERVELSRSFCHRRRTEAKGCRAEGK